MKNRFIKKEVKKISEMGNAVNVEKVMEVKGDLMVVMKDEE